jgi:glycosyltransferase involved in cell wall biosynthesis
LGGRAYLLFLSRIHRKKGCDLLIEAFAKVAGRRSDLDLVIAGPDQEGLMDALQARAQALEIGERIHWPGMLRGDAKWGAFRGAEVFVLPSHQENFGIVVAESLACGTPVLITDKVNIWREVDAGQVGFVETDDMTGVEKLLSRWIETPTADKQAMSARARSVFAKHFDVNHIGPALVAHLKRLSR